MTTPTYDDGSTYRARVSRVVTVGPFKYLPRVELASATGALLNQIVEENGPDAIAHADKL